MSKHPHLPVLHEESLEYFSDLEIKVFFDGTLGAGGHAEGFLREHPEIELYIGCDRDPRALSLASERLSPWKDKVRFVHSNFVDLDRILAFEGIKQVDGFFLT